MIGPITAPATELQMSDRYTKVVHTVIAVCLVVIVLRDVPIISEAMAQSGLYRGGTVAVTIRGIDECASCLWEPLPVKVVP
jgi:hypothetical protein